MSENIMLINPPVGLDRRIVQPLGIASIAGVLRAAGYSNVSIIDGCYLSNEYGYRNSMQVIEGEIERKRPFIVGCTFNNSNSVEIERICKSAFRSGSNVILGGHAATATHQEIAKHFHFMASHYNSSSSVTIVRGEGEETAKEVADALFQGKSPLGIRGTTFYDRNRVVVNPDRELMDLNAVEPPAIDLLPPPTGYAGWFNIEESRGCVFQCSFCSIRSMYPVFRLKDTERIKVEVKRAKELGAEKIYLTGELLLLHSDRALAISDIMKSYDIKWSTSAHPTLINKAEDILPTLKRNGLICVEIGIEAASQRSLDVFNKGSTPKKNREILRVLEKNGIPAWQHLIPFHPYMNMRDLYENMMFISRNLSNFLTRGDYPRSLTHAWIPAEGTPLFERAIRDKLVMGRRGKKHVIYKDNRVSEAKKSYDNYFVRAYGGRYARLHSEVIKAIDEASSEDMSQNQKFMLIETLPISALYVSYSCALAGVPAQKHVDSLVESFFQTMYSGNFNISHSEILNSILEDVDEERNTNHRHA
jgi:radical SAM superfamily enzyme YgiQ (UPF0313 family)